MFEAIKHRNMDKRQLRSTIFRVIFALCCCAIGVAFCVKAHAAARSAPSGLEGGLEGGMGGGLVIVLPFEATGQNAQRLEDELPLVLSQRLAAKGIPVMPHDRMLALIQRLNVQSLDTAAVRRLLAQSGAEAAVYGTYAQVGRGFSISARMVRAKEQGAKAFRVEQPDASNLLFGLEDLAGRLVSELRKFSVIAKVEVRGTRALDPDVVLLRINSRQGDPIDPAVLDRELKRIWDLGYFSDIVVELEQTPSGINLIYRVTEKPRISRIAFEGNDELSEDDLRKLMSLNPGNVLNDKTLFVDLQAIHEAYRKKGYYLAKASYRLEEDDKKKGSAALIITVDEGNRLFITKVNVRGNKGVKAGKIKDQMSLTERWFLSFITGSGVLQEELLESDVSRISQYYMTQGYLDVVVSPIQVVYKESGIELNVQVSEGPRYRVSGVGFSGELIDSDGVLASKTAMRKLGRDKEYFDVSVMQADVESLRTFYGDYGYAFAAVSPRPRRDNSDPKNPKVFITYNIAKNQKVYVRNVIIEGNMHTRDNVILREMRLVDGDQFSGSKLKRSVRRLNNLGFFEAAESELVPTANDAEVDLKIKVREQSTGALMGGFGYSTYSKFGVTASIQESNLWGKGYNLGFYSLFSGLRNSYNLNFTNPRVYDTSLSLGLDAYRWEDDYTDYDRDTNGAGFRVGYPLGEYTGFMVGYRFERYKLSDFADDVSWILRQYEGNRTASVGQFRITRDTTDRSRPTDGTMFQFTTEYAGGILGGDDAFIKLIGEANFYKQITENSVVRLRLRGGTMIENDDDNKPPVFERFWLGGMESLRGYKARDIVPRDTTYDAGGDRVGGTRMAFMNLEYIIQISADIGLNIVPFYDMGFNIDPDQEYDIWDDMKRSVGVELRWRSPMGDLRFCYGYPLDEGWGGKDLSGRFEFSMGRFF